MWDTKHGNVSLCNELQNVDGDQFKAENDILSILAPVSSMADSIDFVLVFVSWLPVIPDWSTTVIDTADNTDPPVTTF
jgi:hypothetical protein